MTTQGTEKDNGDYTVSMSLLLLTKRQITSSLSEKRYYVEVLKGELNSTSTYVLVPAQLTKDNLLLHHIDTITNINVKIDKCELPRFYWLPKLHKNPFISRFTSNSSQCSTTILTKHITSALTAVKDHVIKYSETAFSNSNVNYFRSIKNSSEVVEKLRLRDFQGSQVSSFDFSTLYTSLPLHLNKAKVLPLVNFCFNRESKTYLCSSDKAGFLATRSMTRINVGLVLSYAKLQLSLWKTYMCNLKAWFINR